MVLVSRRIFKKEDMASSFCKILFVLVFFQFVEIHCKDDSGDVPGYGIYDVFIKTEEEVNILQEMVRNKIISVINKKDPFKWKVLVRANNESFLQRKLIEHRMAYIIVKSSLTSQPNDLSTVHREIEELSDNKENEKESARQKFSPPLPSNLDPYNFSPLFYKPDMPYVGYNPYPHPYNPNFFNRYNPYY